LYSFHGIIEVVVSSKLWVGHVREPIIVYVLLEKPPGKWSFRGPKRVQWDNATMDFQEVVEKYIDFT
jgi:hypothetical protein